MNKSVTCIKPHISSHTHTQVSAYTNTHTLKKGKENKVMSLIFPYSYHINPSFLLESKHLEKQ